MILRAAAVFMFPVVAGFVGMFVGAAEGLMCRNPLRTLISGVVGLGIGAAVLFVLRVVSTALSPTYYFAEYVYNPGGVILIDFALAVLPVREMRNVPGSMPASIIQPRGR